MRVYSNKYSNSSKVVKFEIDFNVARNVAQNNNNNKFMMTRIFTINVSWKDQSYWHWFTPKYNLRDVMSRLVMQFPSIMVSVPELEHDLME